MLKFLMKTKPQNKNIIEKVALILILILVTSIAGCIDNAPENTSSTPGPTNTILITPSPTPQTHGIGQSTSDGNTRITVNGVRYAKVINEKNNASGGAGAESKRKFLIMNVTIENISPDKNLSYPGYQFIILADEQIYEEDASASQFLATQFNGTHIAPGERRTGELAFQIPEESKDLKLRFEYIYESAGGLRLEMFRLN